MPFEANMAFPIRQFVAHDTWFITNRCFQARKLMTPHTPMVREVTGGVLAQAAQKYGVQLYAYGFLSNHFHLIIRAHGQTIADFMQYLLCNLSKKLAPLSKRGWRGRFWERRYSAEPILDEPSLERSVRYVVAHGVKEGLVARVADWEGLHCATQLADEQPRVFRWFDWTRRWNARRTEGEKGNSRWAEKFSKPVTLRLTPLPQWEKLPRNQRQALVRLLTAEAEAKHRRSSVLGMKAVKREEPSLPQNRKRSPRPWCHASGHHAQDNFRAEYASFVQAFRHASRDWRRGETDVEFPPGSFKPGVRCRVRNV